VEGKGNNKGNKSEDSKKTERKGRMGKLKQRRKVNRCPEGGQNIDLEKVINRITPRKHLRDVGKQLWHELQLERK